MAQQPRRLRIVTDSTRNPARSRRSNPSETDMAALVDRAANGEREAFDELVRLTHRDAFGLALRLTGNEEDARDVVCLLYTSPSPRDATLSRMPSSA